MLNLNFLTARSRAARICMPKILISNFTQNPDHFLFDGVKTHNHELVQTLLEAQCNLSMLVSVDKLNNAPPLKPVNHFMLNNREWLLRRSILEKDLFKLKLIKSFFHRNTACFDGSELLFSPFSQWGLMDKIYVEELLKRKSTSYYKIRKKLWNIPDYRDYNLFIQNYPFPVCTKEIPSAIFIHDLIPLTHPHLVKTGLSKKCFNLINLIIKQYNHILVISEDTKLTLLRYFDIDEKKIEVVYQSVDSNVEQYNDIEATSILTPLNLMPKKFLLYVARFEPRKNHERLINAYQSANVDLPLVLVGRLDSSKWMLPPSIKKMMMFPKRLGQNVVELGGHKKIIWLEEVTGLTLSVLYRSAKGLIYPSLAEGFGLPIVEAFAHGCPVAAANCTAIPEISGNAALFFNPYCIKEMAKAMAVLCHDADWCTELADLGRARATHFSREQYKKRLMNSLASYF